MAPLNESPTNGTQSAGKQQVTLMNSAFNSFISSPAKPSGSQSPHPNKRLKNLAAIGSPRSEASRSHSPPSQRLSSQPPLSSPARKTFSDIAADEMDGGDRSTPAESVVAATPAVHAEFTPTPPVPTAVMGLVADPEVASTPEPVVPKPGVASSVKKTITSVFNNFTGSRNGTATVTSTFEQTIVSRKRSREPESEDTPVPADKSSAEVETPDPGAIGNDTTIQLGNQFDAEVAAEEERAKSPVKEAVEVAAPAAPVAPAPPAASPAAEGEGEINVTTAADNIANTTDTIEAAEATEPAATAASEDEDEDMADEPQNGLFVLDTIVGHRRDPKDKTLFQMHVRWKHDEPSWEPESNIQEDAEEALFAYWDTVKGGRLGAMADKNLWHVLKVEKHKQKTNGAVELYVCWVGSRDRSWEPENEVQQYARELVEDYWTVKGGREKHIKAIAVPAKRGRGRPRKVAVSKEAPEEPKEQPKAEAAKKHPRAGRKRVPSKAAESVDKKVEETAPQDKQEKAAEEQVEAADGEPPKKRGRGRPRKSVP